MLPKHLHNALKPAVALAASVALLFTGFTTAPALAATGGGDSVDHSSSAAYQASYKPGAGAVPGQLTVTRLVREGAEFTLERAPIARDGYRFEGWAAPNRNPLPAGSTTTMPSEATVYTGVWSKLVGNEQVLAYQFTFATTTANQAVKLKFLTDSAGESAMVNVSWGDGQTTAIDAKDRETGLLLTNTYASAGEYQVSVTAPASKPGLFYAFTGFMDGTEVALKSIDYWSDYTFTLSGAAKNAVNLVSVPASLPAMITHTSLLFSGATTFNQDISGWDVSTVDNAYRMFYGARLFAADISGWSIGAMLNMNEMMWGTAINFDAVKVARLLTGWSAKTSLRDVKTLVYPQLFAVSVPGAVAAVNRLQGLGWTNLPFAASLQTIDYGHSSFTNYSGYMAVGARGFPSLPSRPGYRGHWVVTPETTFVGNTYSATDGRDYTLSTVWELASHNISFNTGGANGSTPGAIRANLGETITLPSASGLNKTGFTFEGWSYGGQLYAAGGTYLPSDNSSVTFTASWVRIPNTVVISYMDPWGVTVLDDQAQTVGSEVVLTAAPDTSTMKFIDWTFGGKSYLAGDKFTVPSEDATFQAYYRYFSQVTFADLNAQGSPPTLRVAAGDSFPIPGAGSLTKPGYTLRAWKVNGITFDVGAQYPAALPAMTLTPVWVESLVKMSFDTAGGTAVPAMTIKVSQTLTSLPTPKRSGYKFAGWSMGNTRSVVSLPFKPNQTRDFTLKANWVKN